MVLEFTVRMYADDLLTANTSRVTSDYGNSLTQMKETSEIDGLCISYKKTIWHVFGCL